MINSTERLRVRAWLTDIFPKEKTEVKNIFKNEQWVESLKRNVFKVKP